ncbi:MAG TPA: hypothetical protein VLE72_02790 [Candidatus Saccharimonadales bacterium]|nr:hypothetical protein [Candidatus Saccharimonadales bacterium]
MATDLEIARRSDAEAEIRERVANCQRPEADEGFERFHLQKTLAERRDVIANNPEWAQRLSRELRIDLVTGLPLIEVSKLFMQCSFMDRHDTTASLQRCGGAATSAVKDPDTGNYLWRCTDDRGRLRIGVSVEAFDLVPQLPTHSRGGHNAPL